MSLQSTKQELSLPIGTLSSSSISSMGTCDEKKAPESEAATLATSAERPSVTFALDPTVTKTMDSEEDDDEEDEDKEEEDKEDDDEEEDKEDDDEEEDKEGDDDDEEEQNDDQDDEADEAASSSSSVSAAASSSTSKKLWSELSPKDKIAIFNAVEQSITAKHWASNTSNPVKSTMYNDRITKDSFKTVLSEFHVTSVGAYTAKIREFRNWMYPEDTAPKVSGGKRKASEGGAASSSSSSSSPGGEKKKRASFPPVDITSLFNVIPKTEHPAFNGSFFFFLFFWL